MKAEFVKSVQHFCCLASKINVLVAYVLIDNKKLIKIVKKKDVFERYCSVGVHGTKP